MSLHRKPPLPEWYDEVSRGICRWCGYVILQEDGPQEGRPNFSRHWHDRCVVEFRFLFWPQETRRTLLRERGAVCEDCGVALRGPGVRVRRPLEAHRAAKPSEVHHIRPLHLYPHDPQDPYAAWRRENLALLCHDCHMARHHGPKAEEPQMEMFG